MSQKFNRLQSLENSWRFVATALTLVLLLGALTLTATPSLGSQGKQKLDKRYKDWLEHDVVYIITKDERDAFSKLTSDEARDKFINDFWDVRNPVPGSQVNAYKEEIYKRIAYTDRFGPGSGTDGWRTDRGRVYITLGAPQGKQIYRQAANLRPFEVWFYANAHPALPTAFYVLFYDRDGTGDYRIYSPYNDGPDKLTTGVEAINNTAGALSMIQSSVGGEVARISLSLIVGEPVDTRNPRPSLSSDVMLSILRGLSEQPSYRDDIRRKWMTREQVTSSMVLNGNNLDIITLPVRDPHGVTRLDFALRLRNPADLAVASAPGGEVRYSIQVRVQVFGGKDKLIFTQDKSLTDGFDKHRYNEIKDKSLSYEACLPLPPGKYRLAFQLTDWNKNTSYRAEREVVIPDVTADKLVLPGILPFSSAEQVDPGTAEVTPFTLAGVRFRPLRTTGLTLNPDVNLQVAYQIWGQAKDPRSYAGQKLHLEYSVGQPAAPGSSKTVPDEAEMSQFDLGGSLVSGKKLDLQSRPPGNYMLTVTAKDPSSAVSGFATMNFKVFEGASTPEPWEVVEPSIRIDVDNGIFDQERGLCYLAEGLDAEGRSWLRRALNANHRNEIARERLVQAYYSQNDFAAVVSLYKDAGITENAVAETYLRIANSLQKTGDVKGAITLAESGLQVHPKDVSLYLGLADFYKQIGNNQKAEDLIKKGKSYSPAS